MAWTLDIDGFRESSEQFKCLQHAHQAILAAASKIEVIQEMARVDPDERASAAQMLVKTNNSPESSSADNSNEALN
ncbi:Protein kinase ATP binding site [Penicillium nucicola]|uniref:Protein kinase ATP binding site n=1 Tax=Penicillium nucicola TaxID=1850975 RepID=UPI0025459F34|nr:Protein kinase ATP binding site [Penicillium nucicola]KAJ5751397.1 Protein kinase ATP binding site [Penicillium nucicola]